MSEINNLIRQCNENKIYSAKDVIRITLAEQHRNTRHDVIELILDEFTKINLRELISERDYYNLMNNLEREIMNLDQRSLLN